MEPSKLLQTDCRYTLPNPDAQEVSLRVLDKLKTLDINANPIHFTLFYELLTKINPDIAEQVEHALQFNAYDESSARVMFNTLWSEVISHSMHSEEFSTIINELILYIESWVNEAKSQHDELNNHMQAIDGLKNPDEIVSRLKTHVLPTIKHYQNETNALQAQIEETSDEIKQLKKELDKATAIAKTDDLTNIPNRRGFNEIIESVMQEANDNQNSFALLVLDLDFFKKINDNYGHLVGDSILRYLAKSLHNETKGKDFIARIGGEEFVAILPHTGYDSALKVANSIRQKIASRPLQVRGDKKPINLTLSVGVAMYQLNETIESLFDRADKSLYMAKTTGRNKVCGEADL
ncbi:diguanylate cyclase [Thiomicrospira sp. XS5]|uniref:diguanylate cyclase n=1 Tax=Thiomicrospira sp. XS5 TaxID=1775636 RepID=UPI0007462785|nr:diguanylate cyclase [Thiomicrospira sp. XS5]KUJ75995.1 diguanylate cyclase [Thiomicrospira sp. XS5]